MRPRYLTHWPYLTEVLKGKADHPPTSQNDTVGEHIKYIDSPGYTFKDDAIKEVIVNVQ